MTLCINESFFKRLTLLQAETPAVTRLGELPMSLFGKRLRPRHQIARRKMRCPGSQSQQSVCHGAGRLVMPRLHWSQRLPGKINARRVKICPCPPLVRRLAQAARKSIRPISKRKSLLTTWYRFVSFESASLPGFLGDASPDSVARQPNRLASRLP